MGTLLAWWPGKRERLWLHLPGRSLHGTDPAGAPLAPGGKHKRVAGGGGGVAQGRRGVVWPAQTTIHKGARVRISDTRSYTNYLGGREGGAFRASPPSPATLARFVECCPCCSGSHPTTRPQTGGWTGLPGIAPAAAATALPTHAHIPTAQHTDGHSPTPNAGVPFSHRQNVHCTPRTQRGCATAVVPKPTAPPRSRTQGEVQILSLSEESAGGTLTCCATAHVYARDADRRPPTTVRTRPGPTTPTTPHAIYDDTVSPLMERRQVL